MNTVWQSLRNSARPLWKSPSFALIAICTLALGIGANATIFSFINGLLLRPLSGVERPDRLVGVYTSDYSGGPYGGSSYPDYLDFRQQADAFSGLAAYDGIAVNLSGSDEAQRLRGESVTSNYFEVLGVRAKLGRTLRQGDDQPGSAPVVVISHSLWEHHFGADQTIIGRAVTLNDHPYTIVGVTAESFRGLRLGTPPEIWMLLKTAASADERGNRGLGITGRLREGVDIQQAQAQITAIGDRLARAYPETNMGTLDQPNSPRPMSVVIEAQIDPSKQKAVAGVASLLLVVVGLVLLIACANMANLLLSRASARRQEIAIRSAFGANRWRLMRLLLGESLFLALAGGAAGLLLTFWTAGLIPRIFPPSEATGLDVSVDWRVLTFTIVISLFTGLLFGLAPALQATRLDLVSALKDRRGVSSRRLGTFGLRGVFVVAQVALSVLLLISAGLFLRSLRNAVTLDPGFEDHNLLLASLATGGTQQTKAQTEAFHQQLLEQIETLPGVRSASLTKVVPLSGGGQRRNIVIEGYQPRPNEDTELNTNVVGLKYFDTLGIPIVWGRDFNASDRVGSPGVVVVNEEFVKRYLSGQIPLGKRLRTDSEGPYLEIIGVARTSKYRNLREPALPIVYIPLAQEIQRNMTLVVRTTGDPSSFAPVVRDVLHRIDRSVPVYAIKSITEQINGALSPDRMIAFLLTIFGGAALLLASLGIYGVVSYAVAQRTHEIGIRMALGARTTNVLGLVVWQGMSMSIVGVVLGVVGAVLLTRLLDSLLFGVTATDLPTFAIVTVGLLLVALLACYIPARRAIKVDPLVALRYE